MLRQTQMSQHNNCTAIFFIAKNVYIFGQVFFGGCINDALTVVRTLADRHQRVGITKKSNSNTANGFYFVGIKNKIAFLLLTIIVKHIGTDGRRIESIH